MKKKLNNINFIIRKNDLLLMAGILLLALFVSVFFSLLQKKGGQVIVTVDGKETARYSLDETMETTIKTAWGENHLKIEGGTAVVTDADCKDKLCVHQKAVSRKGETIVCLPHKLVISIEGAKEGELDGVAS